VPRQGKKRPLAGRRRTTARWRGTTPRRGSSGCAAAVFARAGERGDAPETRRVRERHERGQHSKVGAFTPTRSRTVGRPWRSTTDGHDGGKEQGTHNRRRPKARARTAARTRKGVLKALPLPRARACAKAIAWKRPQRRDKRVGGARCEGKTEPKSRPCPPNSVRACVGAQARECARERARVHAGVTTMAATATRRPGRLTRERKQGKQGRKASGAARAATTASTLVRKLSQPGSSPAACEATRWWTRCPPRLEGRGIHR
jgi:hypothetical protein